MERESKNLEAGAITCGNQVKTTARYYLTLSEGHTSGVLGCCLPCLHPGNPGMRYNHIDRYNRVAKGSFALPVLVELWGPGSKAPGLWDLAPAV